jgi:hypothetical protein
MLQPLGEDLGDALGVAADLPDGQGGADAQVAVLGLQELAEFGRRLLRGPADPGEYLDGLLAAQEGLVVQVADPRRERAAGVERVAVLVLRHPDPRGRSRAGSDPVRSGRGDIARLAGGDGDGHARSQDDARESGHGVHPLDEARSEVVGRWIRPDLPLQHNSTGRRDNRKRTGHHQRSRRGAAFSRRRWSRGTESGR